MPDTFTIMRASEVTERHACVVALEAPSNAGKTYSGCRLAKGMAEAQGKRWCVIDTEGGRTLHLRDQFDFDVIRLSPPHRPERYLAAVQEVEAKGYGACLIDSFSNVWRGIGGVLNWADEELETYVERQRGYAQQYNRAFDENKARNAGKQSSLIRPKVAFKFMMAGLLDVRMPIVLSIRGEVAFDAEAKKEIFKLHMQKSIGFEVTCRFRLAPDRKGIIDITDSEKFKMEGSHAAIFKNGEQISEKHGAALEAWARNGDFALDGGKKAQQPTTTDKPYKWAAASGNVRGWDTAAEWSAKIVETIATWKEEQLQPALDRNIAEIRAHMKAPDDPDFEHASAILRAFSDRGVQPPAAKPAAEQGGPLL